MSSSRSMGPLGLDDDMCRRHGWTDKEVTALWGALEKVYKERHRKVVRRNPKLYERVGPSKTLVFVGPLPQEAT